jgi:hypothetical protein
VAGRGRRGGVPTAEDGSLGRGQSGVNPTGRLDDGAGEGWAEWEK